MSRSTSYRAIREKVRAKRHKRRRGVALILVLGALVVMTVLATEMYQSTSAGLSASLGERDALRAEYAAKSATSLSRLLIATEPMVRKAVEPIYRVALKSAPPQVPVWRFTDMVLGPFNCPEGAAKFTQVAGQSLESGKNVGAKTCFKLDVVDEDAKINLNGAVSGDPLERDRLGGQLLGLFGPATYNEMFEKEDLDGQYSNQPAICGAMVDWADMDELGFSCDPAAAGKGEGPEDNFYQSVGLPYMRKNAPFDSLEELHLVRGVSDDFWANFVDPTPGAPGERVLTVWGQGSKINVNTANAQTILALICANAADAPVCTDVEQMSIFLSAITLAKQVTQGAPLFRSPKAFVRALGGKGKGAGPLFAFFGLEPITFQHPKQVEKSIATESRVFSIYAEGSVSSRSRVTRITTQTVVDFRSANELGASGEEENAQADEQAAPESTELTPEQIAKALASDPMGVVIYHRIE